MKKNMEKIIEIPSGIEVDVKGNEICIKSSGKEIKKRFDIGKVKIIKDNGIKISAKNGTRRESRMIGTIVAHIKNMINGMKEDYNYKMEICNVHFPMNVKVEGNKLIVKTFLGEVIDRHADILPNVKVIVKGNEISISSHDKDAAGQTAANIEKATKIRLRDRRIFQDGIYITEKCGRKI